MKFKILAILVLPMLLIISSVGAAEMQNISSIGVYNVDDARIIISEKDVEFSNVKSGLRVTTVSKVDAISKSPISADKMKPLEGKEEEPANGFDDVVYSYQTIKDGVKETITATSYHVYEFDLAVPDDQIVVRSGESYRIIKKSDLWKYNDYQQGIPEGIQIADPWAIDENGNDVLVWWEWDGRTLALRNATLNDKGEPFGYLATIDPTYYLSGYSTYLKLLINGNNSYNDYMGHSMTNTGSVGFNGTAKIAKFGNGSLYYSGSATQNLNTPSSSDFNFGTGEFTVLMWLNITAASSQSGGIAKTEGATGWTYQVGTGSGVNQFTNKLSGLSATCAKPVLNRWTQVAIVRNGSTISCYVNGTTTGGTPVVDANNLDSVGMLYIGANASYDNPTTGYIDSIAVWKGISIPNASFYPQTYEVGQYVPSKPTAGFTQNVTTGIAPASIGLIDTSEDLPTTWYWGAKNLTPGNNTWIRFSTSRNPNYTFGAGNWSINLTASNDVGSNISTQTSWFNVSFAPAISDFAITNPVEYSSNPVTFTPLGSDGTSYEWTWGDGSTTTVGNNAAQTHSYASTNIYSPSLKVSKAGASDNTTTKSEAVGINSMKYYPTTDGYVSRTTTAAWATIRAGAGTAVDATATTAYARQTATSSASTYSSFNRIIQIYDVKENPIPASSTIINASLNFYGNDHSSTFATQPTFVVTNVSALASLDSITASDFNKYGDTQLSSSNTSYASYTNAGYNRMYLNAAGIGKIDRTTLKTPFMLRTSWDADNAPPTWSASKTAYFRPYTSEQAGTTQDPFLLVNFSAAPVYFSANTTVGLIGASTIQFTDDSPSDGGTYNWSFGDGTYSAVRNASHTYGTQGLFTVKFASPIGGGYEEKMDYINISPPSFYCDEPLSGPLPFTVTCHDTSAVLTGDTHWVWNDGLSTDDGTDVSHTYVVAGDYSVQLQTPSAAGDTTTITSYIHPGVAIPTAAFSSNVTEVAAGGYVKFTDSSANTPTSWRWDFDGGVDADSTSQNPEHQFNTVGNVSVNLTATNGAGSDSEVKTNYIRVYPAGWFPGIVPIASVDFTVSPYPYTNVGSALDFNGTVSGDGQTYKWDFDGGTASTSTALSPSYTYTSTGLKSVNFTAYNAISSGSLVKTNYIEVVGPGVPLAKFSATPTSGTPGVLVSFTDQSLHGTALNRTCNWSFGDAGYTASPFSSICGNVNHVYGYSGVYDVNYSIINDNGSSYQYSSQIVTVSTNQQTQNTWWTPHTVKISLFDSINGNILPGVYVSARYNESSIPDAWLTQLYGIQISPSGDMINSSLSLGGTTGTDGTLTSTMLGSLKYDIYLTSAEYGLSNYHVQVYPSDYMVNIYVPVVGSEPLTVPSEAFTLMNTTRAYIVKPNASYLTMCIDYQDSSGYTTTVTEYWQYANNATVFDNDTFIPGTSLVTECRTKINQRGQAYWFWANATRVIP